MRKYIFIFNLTFLLGVNFCYGQVDSNIFSRGIYIENLKLVIPWRIDFSEIKKYGDPTITNDSEHFKQVLIKWHSVSILNGIKVDLHVHKPKKFLVQKRIRINGIFNSSMDSVSANRLLTFFENYSRKKGDIVKSRKLVAKKWIIDGCMVYVGNAKSYGYYMSIRNLHVR